MLRLMSKDCEKFHLPSRTDHSSIVTYIYACVQVTDSYIQLCYLISLFRARKWEQTKRKLNDVYILIAAQQSTGRNNVIRLVGFQKVTV
jgi:hypothetical protein